MLGCVKEWEPSKVLGILLHLFAEAVFLVQIETSPYRREPLIRAPFCPLSRVSRTNSFGVRAEGKTKWSEKCLTVT